jgi:hypothetical protein
MGQTHNKSNKDCTLAISFFTPIRLVVASPGDGHWTVDAGQRPAVVLLSHVVVWPLLPCHGQSHHGIAVGGNDHDHDQPAAVATAGGGCRDNVYGVSQVQGHRAPGRAIDEDMTPSDTTIDYKVRLFLYLHSNFRYN